LEFYFFFSFIYGVATGVATGVALAVAVGKGVFTGAKAVTGSGVADAPIVTSGICELSKNIADSILPTESLFNVGFNG